MYDDDRCLRIYDYEDDDPCNYYGYNCSMRGKVGNEIQLLTLRLLIFRTLYGHIFYEMLRDISLEAEHQPENKRLPELIDKIKDAMAESFQECHDAEGTSEKVHAPKAPQSFSDKEKDEIIGLVRPETKSRARGLLYGDERFTWEIIKAPPLNELNLKGLV